MRVTGLHIDGYRSLRDLRVELEDLTVIVGPNGVGKTNLYRSLELLQAAASGEFSRTLAREGGMPSALWAGDRKRKERRRLKIAVQMDEIHYALECGLVPPPPEPTAFLLDPDMKAESIHVEVEGRKVEMAWRRNQSAEVRDAEGRMITYAVELLPNESVLAQIQEPHRFPELSTVRQALLQWRFYHDFRSDFAAPARHPQVGVRTPILSPDGSDLGAALQTIIEIGDAEALDRVVADALGGATVRVQHGEGRFAPILGVPGMRRPLEAREMSDGQLRFLCLVAALLSPRPPSLFALNEPETSIHPDLIEPLARLIVHASDYSQVWVTTHSQELARLLKTYANAHIIELEKVLGVTQVCA